MKFRAEIHLARSLCALTKIAFQKSSDFKLIVLIVDHGPCMNIRNHFECLISVVSLLQSLPSALKDNQTNADWHSQAVSLTKDLQLPSA